MYHDFTRAELGTLRKLVQTEAGRLGYGVQYTPENKREWPRRLRILSTIANKIRYKIEDLEDIETHVEGLETHVDW